MPLIRTKWVLRKVGIIFYSLTRKIERLHYALVKEAEEQGIIRKTIHPDTKESWVELSDDSVLPF